MTEAKQARSTRVLILDEDRVEGGMLAFHLRREGIVVMLMTSVEEAADAIAWAAPDVLLVEVTGRGFDGRELLSQLGQLPIDVFAVADRTLPAEVELDALRLGVIEILTKPLDPATLAKKLQTRPERQRRGSVPDLPEGGISGDLAVHSAVHLLQMAHRHRLNARLHAEIDGDWAVLLVRHGEVIDAEAPHATGREAAYQVVRANAGAFVLFPLPQDAEELSRDDVIRADLATLVADALGRKEPRAVNVARSRERDTFVLPHVGSPRGPLAKSRSEETLEYTAPGAGARITNTARVKRPGEKEREAPVEDTTGGVPARYKQPTRPLGPAGPPLAGELLAELKGGASEARTVVPLEAMRRAEERARETREPARDERREGRDDRRAELRQTLDDGFDEATDQSALRSRPRAENERRHGPSTGSRGRIDRVERGDRGDRVDRDGSDDRGERADRSDRSDRGAGGPVTGGGLRHVQGPASRSSARPERARRPTDPELAAVVPPRVARGEPWKPGTLALAACVALLAVFIVWRVVGRGDEAPVDLGTDPEVRLGAALGDLAEGRRAEARTALAALAAEPTASSGVLMALAKVHYGDRRLAEAEALFERLAERHPKSAEVQAWLGLTRAERGQMELARQAFRKAAAAEPPAMLGERLKRVIGPDARP